MTTFTTQISNIHAISGHRCKKHYEPSYGLLLTSFTILSVTLLALIGAAGAQEDPAVSDPSKTAYGEISPGAPPELQTFSFLIGKWEGKAKALLPDGKTAEFPVTWIGRYILDGTAILDEGHAPGPDGNPYLGISFRQYDPVRMVWVIEFLNVNGSFLRKQVAADYGTVEVTGRNVMIASESPGMKIREYYLVQDENNWTYRLDISTDDGENWNTGQMEMTFRRLE